MRSNKRVVAIGGGTGLYTALTGLKRYFFKPTAIVSMADDGGSSGRLRDEFGHLPPGDVRQCLIALSANRQVSRTIRRLFEYRFVKGEGLEGHSVGNLLLTALTEITGSTEGALAEASMLLNVAGRVLPVTTDDVRLCARLEDGTIIIGERHIDVRTVKPDLRIAHVYLTPPARVHAQAETAIREADVIVIGPGDLYTSILPNLLVGGVPDAIRESKALKVYVCNLMTKPGETDGFSVADFASEIGTYLGGTRFIDLVIANRKSVQPELAERYRSQQQESVVLDRDRCEAMGLEVMEGDVLAEGTLVRHAPDALAKLILQASKRAEFGAIPGTENGVGQFVTSDRQQEDATCPAFV
jgi:uncharacterized cofD-like protein